MGTLVSRLVRSEQQQPKPGFTFSMQLHVCFAMHFFLSRKLVLANFITTLPDDILKILQKKQPNSA